VRNAPGSEYLAALLSLVLESAQLIAVPFQSLMGVTDPAGRESGEQKLGDRGLSPALHRGVSWAVF